VAQEDFAQAGERYAGTVLVHGELWQASSLGPVSGGQLLEVQDFQGLTLTVRVAQREHKQTSRDTPLE
jgi:membrane-bound ClpP family serine protease